MLTLHCTSTYGAPCVPELLIIPSSERNSVDYKKYTHSDLDHGLNPTGHQRATFTADLISDAESRNFDARSDPIHPPQLIIMPSSSEGQFIKFEKNNILSTDIYVFINADF